MKKNMRLYLSVILLLKFYIIKVGFNKMQHSNITGTPSDVNGSVVKIVQLVPFFTTEIFCLCVKGTGTVRRHFERLYHDTYSAFICIAQNELLRNVSALQKRGAVKV